MATRYEHTGNAAPTTLSGSITSGSTSISITSATGWPLGSVGPFWVTIDAGTASEEKVLITSRSGTTLTVSARGADGTTAVSHAAGAAIIHSFSATEADNANQLAAIFGISGSQVTLPTSGLTQIGGAFTSSHNPTWAAGATTITKTGTSWFRYVQIGKLVIAQFALAANSTAASGDWTMTLPLPMNFPSGLALDVGHGQAVVAGPAYYAGDIVGTAASTVKMFRASTGTYMGGAVAVSDQWYGSLMYETT